MENNAESYENATPRQIGAVNALDEMIEKIIKDVDDYSNGSAYFYDNKIIIWAKPLDYDLRGSHRWLQDVITHEYTHIVQLGASMKFSRKSKTFFFSNNLNYTFKI